MLNAFEIRHYFDLILTQEDVERQKPDPQGFMMAMNHFGAFGKETVVFEDTDVGYETAKACGATCFINMGFR